MFRCNILIVMLRSKQILLQLSDSLATLQNSLSPLTTVVNLSKRLEKTFEVYNLFPKPCFCEKLANLAFNRTELTVKLKI